MRAVEMVAEIKCHANRDEVHQGWAMMDWGVQLV
jgi:hypothetical protein